MVTGFITGLTISTESSNSRVSSPLEFLPLLPAQLHHYWSFLEPGLHEIKVECRAEWIPEDHYAAIVNGRAECFLFRRDERWLGFYDAYPSVVGQGKSDLKYFVWCIWSKYPRDRESDDRGLQTEDRNATIEFIKHRARELKCGFIETVSPRFFHLRLGFEEYARIYRLAVGDVNSKFEFRNPKSAPRGGCY